MQQFMPAQLLVTKNELERGLQKHPGCPDLLPRWLKGESTVISTYVAVGG